MQLQVKPQTKSDTFRFRLSPETRRKLEDLASNEKRSLSNMLEILIDRAHEDIEPTQPGGIHHSQNN